MNFQPPKAGQNQPPQQQQQQQPQQPPQQAQQQYVPRRHSDEVDYAIHGADLQFVEIELDPGEVAVAEAGAMMYMEQGIQMTTKLGDGGQKSKGLLGGVLGMGKRKLTGENLFMTFFTNNGNMKHKVAFAAAFPGRIVALDLLQMGGTIMCQKHAFLCGAKGVSIDLGFTKRISTGLFGGAGFILQRLQGDGLVFIHAGGTIIEKELGPDDVYYVDTGSLVAFQPSVDFNIRVIKGITSMMFAGEDLFLSTLKGPGKIWIQSLPHTRFVANLAANITKQTKKKSK